jgi:hypothetical protein
MPVKMIDQVKLEYWKKRLEHDETIYRNNPRYNVTIIPDTLRWFLETIEYLQSIREE